MASGHASQCTNEANLNDTSGVNINVNFGNSTGEDTSKQITQVYNINSPREPGCKGDILSNLRRTHENYRPFQPLVHLSFGAFGDRGQSALRLAAMAQV